MANPWYRVTLRPAFVDEDYYDTITIDGSGSIAAWTFSADMLNSAGESVATPSVTIVDADERTVQVAIVGEDLAMGDYTVPIYRTNATARTMVSTGVLEVVDPASQLGWGARRDGNA